MSHPGATVDASAAGEAVGVAELGEALGLATAAIDGAAVVVTAACWLVAGDADAAVSDGEGSADGLELGTTDAGTARLGIALGTALGRTPATAVGIPLAVALGRTLGTAPTTGAGCGEAAAEALALAEGDAAGDGLGLTAGATDEMTAVAALAEGEGAAESTTLDVEVDACGSATQGVWLVVS